MTDVAYDPAVYTGGPAFHFWNKNSEEVLYAAATPLDGGQLGDPNTVYQCALPNVLMGEGLPFFAAFYLARFLGKNELAEKLLKACKTVATCQFHLFNSYENNYSHKNPDRSLQ